MSTFYTKLNRLITMARNNPNTHSDATTFRSLHLSEDNYANQPNFELPDEFFEFEYDYVQEDPAFMVSGYTQNPVYTANEVGNSGGSSSHLEGPSSRDSASGRDTNEVTEKVAFKTESEVEILDDGFKWRKYGKKMVKNSPNPRNYYRCSVGGCPVKKRVERDREDPRAINVTRGASQSNQSFAAQKSSNGSAISNISTKRRMT